MDDEEFKKLVLERFDALDKRVEAVERSFSGRTRLSMAIDEVGEKVERHFLDVDRRLDAVVARLDEQDLFIERLMDKVDRLNTQVALVAQASEQSLDAITRLSKRVTRLEHPDGDFPSDNAQAGFPASMIGEREAHRDRINRRCGAREGRPAWPVTTTEAAAGAATGTRRRNSPTASWPSTASRRR